MSRFRRLTFWFLSGVALAPGVARVLAQDLPGRDSPPAHVSRPIPHNAVARLVKRIAGAEIQLAGSDVAMLRTVLDALNIPLESQLLVFSKTSLQGRLVNPGNPRALYFSDSVYVGWVPGGLIEAVAIDPELGPVFYSFDPQDARDARRSFVRETSCLRCHQAKETHEVPGFLARSIFPTETGESSARPGPASVDDETPFEQRWGGWYVTGYAGKPNHRGNAFGVGHGDRFVFAPIDRRPKELSGYFDTSKYLAATSDVVALSIFEHQLGMHNSLGRAAQLCRRALADQQSRQKSAGQPVSDEPIDDGAKSAFATATQDVLDHLLFRNAAPLPDGVAGSDAFRHAFAADARRDGQGDALKDLSLHGRLFANRCSFLIYSESFNALPPTLKSQIYRRLFGVLGGDDPDGRYAYLEKDEKRRILEVLRETQPEAAQYFQNSR